MKGPKEWLAEQWTKLREIRDSPHAIALGIAVGMFWGFVPLYGLKMLLALITSIGFRANKLSAMIAVNLHDLLFPIAPFLFGLELYVGTRVLEAVGVPVEAHRYHGMHLTEMLNWTTFLRIGEPLLIGSLIVAGIASPVIYLIARSLIEAGQTSAR